MRRIRDKTHEERKKHESNKNKIANDERPPEKPGFDPPKLDVDEIEYIAGKTPAELGLSDDWRDYGWLGGKDADTFNLDGYLFDDLTASQSLEIILGALVDGSPANVISLSKLPIGKSESQVRVEQAKRLLTGEKTRRGPPPKEVTDWDLLKKIARRYFQAWLELGEVSETSKSAIIRDEMPEVEEGLDHKSVEDRIHRTREAFDKHKHQLLVEVTHPDEWMNRGQMDKVRQVLQLLRELGLRVDDQRHQKD